MDVEICPFCNHLMSVHSPELGCTDGLKEGNLCRCINGVE